ncbi:MAG: DUF4199 domain-containing protein [Bacteroidota bacterium]
MIQDTTQSTHWQLVIKYAIAYALSFIGFQLLLFIASVEQDKIKWIVFIINMAISFAVLFISLRSRRNEQLGGYISYGKALATGSLILLLASAVMAVWTYIFAAFIDADGIKASMELAKRQMIENGASEEQIAMGKKMADIFSSPSALAVTSFFGTFIIGFIALLITGIFVQKVNPDEAYNSLEQ